MGMMLQSAVKLFRDQIGAMRNKESSDSTCVKSARINWIRGWCSVKLSEIKENAPEQMRSKCLFLTFQRCALLCAYLRALGIVAELITLLHCHTTKARI